MNVRHSVLLALAVFAAPSFADVPVGPPVFSDPLVFTNAFAPFQVGAVKVFSGKSDGEKTAVVDLFTADTRSFAWGGGSVECAVLQETEFSDGQTSEISLNYFAQSDDGTVWYFGEVVDIYENGVVVAHDGSWLVGGASLPSDPVDTATALEPGLFMPATPAVGDFFKPEDLFPLVDETVTVIKLDQKLNVPSGKYAEAMKVEETSLIGDSDPEFKWYVRGLGVVKTKAKGEVLNLLASTLLPAEGP